MSTMLRAFARLDHVDQPSFCGHGESISEAVNSIEYISHGMTVTFEDLVAMCENLGVDLEVVVLNGDKRFIVKAGDLPKIREN